MHTAPVLTAGTLYGRKTLRPLRVRVRAQKITDTLAVTALFPVVLVGVLAVKAGAR